ncbi:MAG: hypothetical protein JSW27_24570 [Phycisphaerales bacterium]|nr:MAG: hypothetical protein JSW27_24570 [Phycisphaerales bacterium]
MRRKVIVVGVMGSLVALIAAGVSMAQPPRGQGGQRGPFEPERMRQMMEERLKEQLGTTDAEWQVIGPRLTKVMNLSRETQMGGGMARMFMRGRRGQGGPMGGPPQGAAQEGERRGRRGPFGMEETAVSKASDALQTTLENASASPEEIKAKLTALRTAKEKARQELATAQKELREVLSLRQEAQLVLMGMLN